jgi:hypothetical protein
MRYFNFSKPKERKIELLSVHIPKTAGTSFRLLLGDVYGTEQVARLDITLRGKHVRLHDQPYLNTSLPNHYSVLHGHFSPQNLYSAFDIEPSIPIITWLRHPVDRVLSHYFYLQQQLSELMIGQHKYLRKIQRTLLEFAADPINQNHAAMYLQGKNIDDYFFVGLVEQYDHDIKQLSTLLGWKDVQIYKENITPRKENRIEITNEMREKIEAWNPEDMALYNYIVSKKKKKNTLII